MVEAASGVGGRLISAPTKTYAERTVRFPASCEMSWPPTWLTVRTVPMRSCSPRVTRETDRASLFKVFGVASGVLPHQTGVPTGSSAADGRLQPIGVNAGACQKPRDHRV
jgi:hypothetical protein